MTSTPLPYRFALGELNGRYSYIMQCAKGLFWRNIPNDLVDLLQTLSPWDVTDFSLGSDGRYYIKYRQGTQKRLKLSRGLWSEIEQDPTQLLDRLTLGGDGRYWGVMLTGTREEPFGNIGGVFSAKFYAAVENFSSYEEVRFVALGCEGDWAFGDGSMTSIRGSASLGNAAKLAHQQNRAILSVVLSPADRRWLIILEDGSIKHSLPPSIAAEVTSLAIPENSLSKLPTPGRVLPLGAPLLRALVPASREFLIVLRIFRNGWKHSHKRLPLIRHIYKVNISKLLESRYASYCNVLAGRGVALNEMLLFHGSRRQCVIGNSPLQLDSCKAPACRLCGILTSSFRVERAGTAPNRNFLRFGRGIYTTTVSSKADDYNQSGLNSTHTLKTMLVARVALGRSFNMSQTRQTLTRPPPGYHSVYGKVGLDLNYDEQVVYQDEAILPAYLIVYGPR